MFDFLGALVLIAIVSFGGEWLKDRKAKREARKAKLAKLGSLQR